MATVEDLKKTLGVLKNLVDDASFGVIQTLLDDVKVDPPKLYVDGMSPKQRAIRAVEWAIWNHKDEEIDRMEATVVEFERRLNSARELLRILKQK